MSFLKILVMDSSLGISTVLKKTLALIDSQIDCIDCKNKIRESYNSRALDKYSLLIMNLNNIDSFYPQHVIYDAPVIKHPPILGISVSCDYYKISQALNRGIDDCITYPFHKEYFLAKVRALARRPKSLRANDFSTGSFEIHRDKCELKYKSNKVDLTRKEYMILLTLLENRERTLTKEELIDSIWSGGKIPGPNSIDAHISNIRRKLSIPKKNGILETVHGIGYRIKNTENS